MGGEKKGGKKPKECILKLLGILGYINSFIFLSMLSLRLWNTLIPTG